jgi:hypothetical protein
MIQSTQCNSAVLVIFVCLPRDIALSKMCVDVASPNNQSGWRNAHRLSAVAVHGYFPVSISNRRRVMLSQILAMAAR